MAGWAYLPRFIDKIRLSEAGQLHEDYQPNYLHRGFDAKWLEKAGLEAALRGWLRDAPGAEPSDDAFVENPFHNKPGFGGSDALRCICQNPDEPFWPDGHADDDDVEF